jgi:hypothetical protein
MQTTACIQETRAAAFALEARVSAVLSQEPITQLLADISNGWLRAYAQEAAASQGHGGDPVTTLTTFLRPDCAKGKQQHRRGK